MYQEGELKQDILDSIEMAAGTVGYIIASCKSIPDSNEKGDNPPHKIAADRYKEVAPSGFLVTHEHPNHESPEPIVFEMTGNGFTYRPPFGPKKSAPNKIASAISAARGASEPPASRVGFGGLFE